jgi:hypothetical protein
MSSKHLLAVVLACAIVAAGCDDPRLYPPKTGPIAAAEADAPSAALTSARGAKPRAAAGPAVKGASTMLDLLPEGTVGIVCVPKVKDFEQAFDRLSALASPKNRGKPMGLPTLVRTLGLDINDFDVNRGACFAMTFTAGSNRPLMTAILPVRDEKTVAGKLRSIHPKSSVDVSDGFAILTEKGTYKRGGTPAGFGTPLPDGDLVVRFDAAAIWKKFGPVLTSELKDGLEAIGGATGAASESAALGRRILEGIKSVAETASVYDLALRVDGSQMELDAAVRFADGVKVPIVDCFSKADLSALARTLPTEGLISMAMAVDASRLWAALEPVAAASLEAAPESTREAFRHAFDSIGKGMKVIGSGMAVTGGIHDGRIEAAGVMETRDPAAYIASTLGIISDLPADGSPLTITPPEERTVDGTKVTTVRLRFDPDKMPGATNAARTAQSREAVDALFGKDGLAYNFVAMENRLLFVMGGDDLVERVIRAARAGKDAPATPLSKALAAAGSDTVAYVNFDAGGFVREMMAIASRGGGSKTGRKPPVVLTAVESNPVSFILNASPKQIRARVSLDIEKTAKLASASLPR